MRTLILFITLSFIFQTKVNAQICEVVEVSPMPESVANNAVVAGEVNGTPYIYSFGGIDDTKIWSGIHNRSFRYNTISDSWETIPSLPDDMPKIAAGASRIGDIIYIIGGYTVFSNGSELSSNKIHRYDMESNTYLSDGTQLPSSIDDHVQAVWRDSLIYVITGWSNSGNVPFVQIYDPVNNSWAQGTQVPNNNDYKSFGASGVIKGDTIYYFGGAKSISNFPIQNDLRIGIIDPNDPTDITWSISEFASDINGYRMGATTVGDGIYWIGGSGQTYNFDGIAYSNNTGVPPLNRILNYFPESNTWDTDFNFTLPMDLRGVGEVGDELRYICGGMMANQAVSNKTYRLNFKPLFTTQTKNLKNKSIKVFPNPATDLLQLEIEMPTSSNNYYTIYDSNGNLIEQQLLPSNPEINLKGLESGVYIINLIVDGQGYSQQFVKIEE